MRPMRNQVQSVVNQVRVPHARAVSGAGEEEKKQRFQKYIVARGETLKQIAGATGVFRLRNSSVSTELRAIEFERVKC